MRKIILIIFIAMISSFSYYGSVNEKGERITNFENVMQNQDSMVQKEISNQKEIQENNIEMQNKEEKNQEQQESAKKVDTSMSDNKTGSKVQVKNEVKKDIQEQGNTINNKTQDTKTTTNTNTENSSKEQNVDISQNNNYTEIEVKVAPKTECIGNNHKIDGGNTGKWFETKEQADNYYNTEIEKWDKEWESGKIDKSEYLKKCPSGYEVWTCPQCQKWTINFYYR